MLYNVWLVRTWIWCDIGRFGFMLRNIRRKFREVKLKRKRWITNAYFNVTVASRLGLGRCTFVLRPWAWYKSRMIWLNCLWSYLSLLFSHFTIPTMTQCNVDVAALWYDAVILPIVVRHEVRKLCVLLDAAMSIFVLHVSFSIIVIKYISYYIYRTLLGKGRLQIRRKITCKKLKWKKQPDI